MQPFLPHHAIKHLLRCGTGQYLFWSLTPVVVWKGIGATGRMHVLWNIQALHNHEYLPLSMHKILSSLFYQATPRNSRVPLYKRPYTLERLHAPWQFALASGRSFTLASVVVSNAPLEATLVSLVVLVFCAR